MTALEGWHKWYEENKMIASLDDPLMTKASRENLHDTSNAVNQFLTDVQQRSFDKAVEYFADTIVEFSSDLSAEQLFKALTVAAKNNYEFTKKEYDSAKKFMELINGI